MEKEKRRKGKIKFLRKEGYEQSPIDLCVMRRVVGERCGSY